MRSKPPLGLRAWTVGISGGPAALLALAAASVPMGAMLLASCQASPSLPPLLGTIPIDSGMGALNGDTVNPGLCPGTGSVSVAFDGGSGQTTCWSAFAYQNSTQPTVTVSGNLKAKPGLAIGVTLYDSSQGKTLCSLAAGSKLALDGPCVSVAAAYVSAAGEDEWIAYGGSSLSVLSADASKSDVHGTLTVNAVGLSLGNAVSIEFSPDSTLIVDKPGYPMATISGTVSTSIE
jgi:hypothetical protein